MVIYDANNIEIAGYKVYSGKGRLICNNNFKRDYSSKIEQLIDELSGLFNDPGQAKDYLQQVQKNNPRYIRDQLHLLGKLTEQYGMYVMNNALKFCLYNKILKVTDMESLARKLQAEYGNANTEEQEQVQIRTLNKSAFKIIPEKSNISDYKNLMN